MTHTDMTLEEARDAVLAAFRESGREPLPRAKLIVDAYAAQHATRVNAQARVDAEGLIVEDAKGKPEPHPAIAIAKAATAELTRLHAQLVKESKTLRGPITNGAREGARQ